jgi:hypothetical protein
VAVEAVGGLAAPVPLALGNRLIARFAPRVVYKSGTQKRGYPKSGEVWEECCQLADAMRKMPKPPKDLSRVNERLRRHENVAGLNPNASRIKRFRVEQNHLDHP